MSVTIVITTAAISFFVTSILGLWLIPFLKKLKYGQTILDIGPSWHKNKQGTPTMGGILFVIGIVISVVIGYITYMLQKPEDISELPINNINNVKLIAGMILALASGFIGFIDDYVKVVKKRNLGLTAGQKLSFQIAIGILYLATIYLCGDTSTILIIPFIAQIDLGVLYYPLALFLIVGFTNAVNLTDGIDGLASSVTFIVALSFMVMSTMLANVGMNLMATALAGGLLGFLVWNFHPAKVFMGDVGSLFLGGMVVALAFGINMPIILLISGIIYVIETGSVILQVISFKTTGKRIFKMSPIHHHFEMSGYSENKIVILFSAITLLACILAVLGIMNI